MIWQDKLERIRNEHGMTINELAQAIGKSKSTIHNWNNNTSSPNRNDMQKIATLFKTTPHLLFFDESDVLYPAKKTVKIKKKVFKSPQDGV